MSGNNAYFTTNPAVLMGRWKAAASPSPTPTPTPSPSGCNCYQNVYVDVTTSGTINWTLCNACGPGGDLFLTGSNQLITDPCCIDITTLSGTATFTIASYDTPCCGVPASPSATPSITPTVTPTVTPSISVTPTPTPSCVLPYLYIENGTKNILVSMEVNNVPVTYSSGTDFPIEAANGTFTTNQVGTGNQIIICYNNKGQGAGRIYFTACDSTYFCCDFPADVEDCCTFNDVAINCGCTINIYVDELSC